LTISVTKFLTDASTIIDTFQNYVNGDEPCEPNYIPVYNSEFEAIDAGWKKINDTWVCPTCQKE
jgi:hypothetical protein